MTKIYLSAVETKAIDYAMSGDLSDPVALMKEAGCDVSIFFEFGDWRGADFRKSDLRGISFRGADLRGARLTSAQRALIAHSNPKFFPEEREDFTPGGKGRGVNRVGYGEPDAHRTPTTRSTVLSDEELIDLVVRYNPSCNTDLLRQAYKFASEAHEGQFRKSGVTYFSHPVGVAAILIDQQLDDVTIATALLHDTIGDTEATYADVERLFGLEVAGLVAGVTKVTNLNFSSDQSNLAENVRKLIMEMSKDLRIILVKLADRLHNMRTMRLMSRERQIPKSRETMDIFAPLAGRLGIQWMREELEDLGFRVLNPEARTAIIRRFLKLQMESGNVINQITADISTELRREKIESDVYGRAKKPYSIWRKMQEKDLAFYRLSNVYGFRIICSNMADCYRIVGIIHQRWRAVPGRFKDYISQPKSNGYRSIHTAVSGRDGMRFEVQIRTREMNEVAEAGVAAHWSYSGGVRNRNPFVVDPGKWIANLLDRLNEDEPDQFIESVRLESYPDQIFCFTPRGDVVQLPRGATPLDYAYAIHTRIGNSSVSANVDGESVPLSFHLKNGQMVEIFTEEQQTPQTSWLDFVQTDRAKTTIRRELRDMNRKQRAKYGRELTRALFEMAGKKATSRVLERAATKLGYEDIEDMLAQVGSGEITALVVLSAEPKKAAEIEKVNFKTGVSATNLPVDRTIERAACCQPLPGERIVGISYRNQRVALHAIDCHALIDFESQPSRWVELNWADIEHRPLYTVSMELMATNDIGILRRVRDQIVGLESQITDIRFIDRKPDFLRLVVDVVLSDVDHLYRLTAGLEAQVDVASVSRLRDLRRKPKW